MYENPMYNPTLMPYLGMPAQRPIPRQEVIKVNGENGARSYQMGANSSALLLDESGTMVWLATTDGAGYKTVAAFDITPHQVTPAPDFSSLEQRISELERKMNNASTNSANAEQAVNYNAYTAAPANDKHDQKHGKSAGNA